MSLKEKNRLKLQQRINKSILKIDTLELLKRIELFLD